MDIIAHSMGISLARKAVQGGTVGPRKQYLYNISYSQYHLNRNIASNTYYRHHHIIDRY